MTILLQKPLYKGPTSPAGASHTPIQMAKEKVWDEIYDRVNTSNMLLYQLRQRVQTRDKLQRRLQQLQDIEMDDKQRQAQLQAVRQLQNETDKVFTKIRAGQKVTRLYLAIREVLRKEMTDLRLQLDLLCGNDKLYREEQEDMELMALNALKATDVTKEEVAKTEAQCLADSKFRYRSLADQKVDVNRLWLKEAGESHLGAKAKHELAMGSLTLHPQDLLMGTKLEATKSRMQHEALVTEKMERAKAVVERSCFWDIPNRLLAQQKSLVDLEQYVNECKEKKQALKEELKELELKLALVKFRQPPNTTRAQEEEELRMKEQQEEARLEQYRAQILRNEEFLFQFEIGIEDLFARLRVITVPGQDDSGKAMGVEEKLWHCHQKLKYLMQQMADLPPDILDENDTTFVKVRDLLEQASTNDQQNLRISLEDTDSGIHDPIDFAGKDQGRVLTREEIKNQGLELMKSMRKSKKKSKSSSKV
ncbi:coiled-coil domain-containing protein 183-like [Nyctibius grandis]|uniref:coiled-coil domain-containing protein 183-like n=1 Tax=Nyctibius grandis TaxID=48427 RepID=UPI0035BBA097